MCLTSDFIMHELHCSGLLCVCGSEAAKHVSWVKLQLRCNMCRLCTHALTAGLMFTSGQDLPEAASCHELLLLLQTQG